VATKLTKNDYQNRVDAVNKELAKGTNKKTALLKAGIQLSQYNYALEKVGMKKAVKAYRKVKPSARAEDLKFTLRTSGTAKHAITPATKSLAQELRTLADKVERVTEAFKAI